MPRTRFHGSAWLSGIVLASLSPAWAGQLLIEVQESAGRTGNRMPARVRIDFREVLQRPDARINPATLKLNLVGSNPDSSAAIPVRFDDPDPKPDSFFHAHLGGGGVVGELVFQHTASEAPVTRYRLSFDEWSHDDAPPPASPAPQIGDYDILRYARGPLSGVFHTKLAIADWDHDGRLDLLAGDGLGVITLYRRSGSDPSRLEVPMLLQAGGQPLDVGWTAAPEVVDWDGDGDLDLLSGEEARGGVLFYENTGTVKQPRLAAARPLLDRAGEMIISPHEPVAEMPFFKKDYSPCPRAVDYNGDGRVDLLLGGYVTGRVFYYENVAATAHEQPRLEHRGPLKLDDGTILDVTWSATPELADLDADGDLDMICGHIAERKDRFAWSDAPSVKYYENVGTREEPRWQESRLVFPQRWSPFLPDVTVPRLADWDGDGDLDLLMGGRCEAFRFENVGDPRKPRFEYRERFSMANGPFLTNYNLNAVAPCFGDLNGDGLPDLLRGGSGDIPVALMTSFGNTPEFTDAGVLEAGGKPIYVPFVHGDDTSFPFLFDWDEDGDLDLLQGDGDGFVWYYRNEGDRKQWRLAAGRKFQTADGKDLCVGPLTPAEARDFEQHSGNRSVPAPADYDGDGRPDLICSNAEGKVFFYRNVGQDRFAPGVELATGNNRCFAYPVDWDADGRPDVLLSWSGGSPAFYLNRGEGPGGAPRFEVVPVSNMPWIPHPRPMALDWDRDGDTDLLLASSYALLHFASRDFIEHGYKEAKLVPDTPEAHSAISPHQGSNPRERSSTTIVAFGDSTTAPRGGVRVFAAVLEERLVREGDHARVINAGIGGNNTRQARERLTRDVIEHHPLVVTLSFGINDSAVDVFDGATQPRVPLPEYEKNLAHMVQQLQDAGILPILMTPNPVAWTDELKKLYASPPYRPDDADGWNVLLKDYAEAVRRIAAAREVPLVDTDRLFRAYAAEPGHDLHDLMTDGMHPNDAGHAIIAVHLAGLIRTTPMSSPGAGVWAGDAP